MRIRPPGPRGSRPPSPVLDEGLQPERTLLAWRRTAVALALGSVVGTRVLAPSLGLWSLLAGLVGVVAAGLLGVAGLRRFLALARQLDGGGTYRSPGGTLPAVTAVLVLLAALCGAAYVVGRAL